MPDLRPLLRAMLDKILNPIVDLILGYSEIDFEKIIQEERQKAAGRRCRTPPEDRPEPAEGSPHPGQPPPGTVTG